MNRPISYLRIATGSLCRSTLRLLASVATRACVRSEGWGPAVFLFGVYFMSSRTNLKSLTDLNFTSEVYESDVPVVVEFFADWCVSCKSLFPILDELAKEYGDKVKICTVNIEKAPAVSQECQIMGVPKIVVVNNGAVVAMFAGFRDNIKSILSGRIEELLYS